VRRRISLAAGAAVLAYVAACAVLSWRHRTPALAAAELAQPAGASLPPGFLLGTATSSHQIEGGTDGNDWAEFERQPGRVARGERSGRAVDHWNRVAEDVALMRALGANAYRFSIEWSRVEPEEGRWDEAAWSHYADEVRRLRAAGIVPMVTLLHFTLPRWLQGGATAAAFPERFGRFAGEAARRLGAEVDLWCTINEPNVQMYLGWVEGVWPPGRRSPTEAVQAFASLLRAHAAAAAAVRRHDAAAQVGVVSHLVLFDPASRASLPDWIAAREADRAFNWAFTDSIAAGRMRLSAAGMPKLDEPLPGLLGSSDFIGLNYYRREMVRFAPRAVGLVEVRPGPGERNDLGWEIHPAGLLRLLREAHQRYPLPLYVTENGIPDAAGTRRGSYLRAHLRAVERAVGEGVPVRGYFHWSLLDNFEWAEGFAPRFGLYRVDYATMERTPAGGAEEFRETARRLR
jgi:beta-glucosidase